MNPLLSICIPTYNRGKALNASLDALTSDPAFLRHDDIEIVISDNASTDDTEQICRSFVARFPHKVVYRRQFENVGYSANLEKLTEIACGEYLKFLTDNLAFKSGVLDKMLSLVEAHRDDKLFLFWGGDDFAIDGQPGCIYCNDADTFMKAASHATTWIAAYGFWKLDASESIRVNRQYASLFIPQTAVCWHMFAKYRRAVVYHERMVYEPAESVCKVISYNIPDVFGGFYLKILRDYQGRAGFSNRAYHYEKRKVFKNIVFAWYFDFTKRHPHVHTPFFKHTKDYHKEWYFWLYLACCPVFFVEGRIRSVLPGDLRKKFLPLYRLVRKLI